MYLNGYNTINTHQCVGRLMVLIGFNNVFWGWIDVHLTVVTLDPVTK